MFQLLVTNSQEISFPTMSLPLCDKTSFIINDPAAPYYPTKPELIEATLKNMSRRESASISFPSHGNENKEDGIFAVFTGAYSRGESNSESIFEMMESRRARALSTAGYEYFSEDDNESCTSDSSSSSSRSPPDLLVSRRRFVPDAPQQVLKWLPGSFRQPSDYDKRCKASLVSSVDSEAILAPLDGEQNLLSMRADTLIKKSGWLERPYDRYAAMFGNPEPDEDALLEAAELAKDLYMRVILLSGDIELEVCSPAAAVGMASAVDCIFASVLKDLDACSYPEPTAYILRYLVVSCANIYWDPHSALFDSMLRRDALGRLAFTPDRSVSCPQSTSSPIEARIYKRAMGLIGFSGALFARSILCLDDFRSLILTLLVNVVCVARSQALLVLLSAAGPELGVRNLKPLMRGLHGELKIAACDSKLNACRVSDSLLMCANLIGYRESQSN